MQIFGTAICGPRIHLYHRKMAISKRSNECGLNTVGSFTGGTWRLF